MNKVSILKCDNYNIDKVKSAARASINQLGGITEFVKPGEKVLLKVNLLMKRLLQHTHLLYKLFQSLLLKPEVYL